MLLAENDLIERIESPLNLLNRLRKSTRPTQIPSMPSSSELIPDLEDKLKYGSAKSKALKIMDLAMDELKNRIPEVHKPSELARIASEMGKVIANTEIKSKEDTRQAQIIIYAPSVIHESQFDVLDIQEKEE